MTCEIPRIRTMASSSCQQTALSSARLALPKTVLVFRVTDRAEDVIKSMDPNWKICRHADTPTKVPGTKSCGRWFHRSEHDHPWATYWDNGPAVCPACWEYNGHNSRAWNERGLSASHSPLFFTSANGETAYERDSES